MSSAHTAFLLGTAIEPEHTAPRPGDVRHSQADISRAQTELGYQPATDVARGLRNYVNWFVEERVRLESPAAA